jgi:predicted MPP superfamily phosphohydrolase
MRSFLIITLLTFLVFYILTSLGAWSNIRKISGNKKIVNLVFWLLNFLVFAGYIILYIYPFQPRAATNYQVYFFFNTLLFSVFLFNVPMAISFLMQKALKKESKQHIISYSGFILAISLTTGMLFGTLAGSRQLKVTQVELTFQNLPLAFNDYQIVQLSDFHLGGMLKPERILTKTKQKLDDFDTDLILFTGDLVNNFANEISGLESELKDITSLAESYSILGNHDYGDYADWESLGKKHANFEAILNAQKDAGFQLLNNEHLVLSRGTDSIYLAGVENWGHPPFPQYANLEAAINGIPSDAFTILMTHDPAHWEAKVAGKENIALTLSGHTHGLQWGIKFAGIPFSLAWLTRQNWGGLYKKNNSALYVNTGLGTVGMPWRLDMPGEITVITLKRSEID